MKNKYMDHEDQDDDLLPDNSTNIIKSYYLRWAISNPHAVFSASSTKTHIQSTPLVEDWHIGTSLFGHQYTTDVKQLTQQQLPNFFKNTLNLSNLSSRVHTQI